MSFFDRQGIPESILRIQQSQKINQNLHLERIEESPGEEDGDSASGSDADQRFEDDIISLCDYSLISLSEHNTVLTMHRLVQLTVRAWLKTPSQLE